MSRPQTAMDRGFRKIYSNFIRFVIDIILIKTFRQELSRIVS